MNTTLQTIEAKDYEKHYVRDAINLVYLPEEYRFFLVDGFDVLDDRLELIFEAETHPGSWQSIEFGLSESIQILVADFR